MCKHINNIYIYEGRFFSHGNDLIPKARKDIQMHKWTQTKPTTFRYNLMIQNYIGIYTKTWNNWFCLGRGGCSRSFSFLDSITITFVNTKKIKGLEHVVVSPRNSKIYFTATFRLLLLQKKAFFVFEVRTFMIFLLPGSTERTSEKTTAWPYHV